VPNSSASYLHAQFDRSETLEEDEFTKKKGDAGERQKQSWEPPLSEE
jgi:hypothetical protein